MAMKQEIAERVKKSSEERPQRIVIDEELPDGSFRILISRMKTGVSDDQKHDSSAWEDEEEQRIDLEHLKELISEALVDEVAEGNVFGIKQRKPADIHIGERERMKKKTAKLLVREGKSMRKAADERW